MARTAKSLVMKPQYRHKVIKAVKGKNSYTRKIKHKNQSGHGQRDRTLFSVATH